MTSRPDAATGIVVPVRSFTLAKARLAPALDRPARAALARTMAERVVSAAGDHPVAVVSSAPEVCEWATARGLDVLADPGSLDDAAHAGRAWAAARGLVRYAVAHADLPRATSFDLVLSDGDAPVAVIVPDHRDDGTPVLSLPTDAAFAFAYGPGSAARHADVARRLGLDIRIVRDPSLAFDVDVPDDLAVLAALERAAAR
ncbi:MAG TPA: 2-phospho-L-lactate guanylyltransferase [Acidimicrobiia bacterium]|nr:2-phospho-L-lactate guanylyltransferase [Acidimicrobiia bacterium]